MKRLISYEEYLNFSKHNFLSPNDVFNEPFDHSNREKPLRTVPRKISNVEENEFIKFDKWLTSEKEKEDPNPDLTNQEKKARPDKVISQQDQETLNSVIPIYRKISFTSVPTQFKPNYEQEENFLACISIKNLMDLRKKYIDYDEHIHPHPFLSDVIDCDISKPIPDLLDRVSWNFKQGIIAFEDVDFKIISKQEYYSDLQFIMENIYSTVNKSFSYLRLKMLMMKFNVHLQCNLDREAFHQKVKSRKDFYTIMKIDNHVHITTCMNQKHLQKFIKTKLKEEPKTIVSFDENKKLELEIAMKNLGLDASTLTVDVVNSYNLNRLEKYSNKYNPFCQLSIKNIFLNTENYINGRFFAEIVKEVIKGIDKEKYVLAEYRICVYGKSPEDLKKQAFWLSTYNIKSHRVRWVIQIPRLYSVFKQQGLVKNFGEILSNIFTPIIEATINPIKYPEIHQFLEYTVAFDVVSAEEKNEKIRSYSNYKLIDPDDWNCNEEPTYSYWNYYVYANLKAVNHLRRSRGMNTFAYRPHCGETESSDHMAVGYLLSHSINHGIMLSKYPVLQYLFYLNQIGLSLSPLSNNKILIKFSKNPLAKFFSKGLNISLSTDDPLSTHLTKEPLMEEYSVVAQTLNLNAVDLCEIARNSVLQSGFPIKSKMEWLGDNFLKNENDSSRSNLSSIRFTYRLDTFKEEHEFINKITYKENEI